MRHHTRLLTVALFASQCQPADGSWLDKLLGEEGGENGEGKKVTNGKLGTPSMFGKPFKDLQYHCEENGVVSSWCDTTISPMLTCALLKDSDLYGCACEGNAAACPTECVGGTAPQERSHYGIQCRGIPPDNPNYILKDRKKMVMGRQGDDTSDFRRSDGERHCEDNGVVAGWCDESVNPHLKCSLFPRVDEYMCSCGRVTACPTDCIGGDEPHQKTHYGIRCRGIPMDQPNYELV